jgi:hypothetical protein
MKINQILGIAAAIALAGGSIVAMADSHGDSGSCVYVQENMFAGPFDVCQAPVDADGCAEIGQTDDNADAVHSAGACSLEGLVGTCDIGTSKVHYLTGDPGGLEIGCGFQGGDWIDVE